MAIQAVVKTGVESSATLYPNTRKIARGCLGDLWCVFSEENGSERYSYLGHSKDNGATWTTERIPSPDKSGEYRDEHVSIAIDDGNNIHIAWRSFDNIYYICKTHEGWGSEERVDTVDTVGYVNEAPAIAVSSSGDVHIVWRGNKRGTNSTIYQIVYRAKLSGTWQAEELVTDVASAQNTPAICLDSNEDIHVVWPGKGWGTNTGYDNIQYRKRTTTWQTQEAITDAVGLQMFPSLSMDSSDQPHVCWTGRTWGVNTTINNVQYRMRTTSWQAQESVTDIASNQGSSSITVDSSDHVHVVWTGLGWGTNTTKNNLQYNKRTTSWGSQVAITDLAFHQRYPVLIGAVHPITGGGVRTNLPDAGYAFVWSAEYSAWLYRVEYYGSSDLDWPYVPMHVKYASGQAKEVFT